MSRRPCSQAPALHFVMVLAALCAAWPAFAADDVIENPQVPLQVESLEEKAAADKKQEENSQASASAWREYGSSVGNRYLIGINSLVTFPADPVMATVHPLPEFDKLPLGVATKYPVGFGQGTLLSIYRAAMGAFDVVFAPLTPMKLLSPEPRYMIFPGVEHPDY